MTLIDCFFSTQLFGSVECCKDTCQFTAIGALYVFSARYPTCSLHVVHLEVCYTVSCWTLLLVWSVGKCIRFFRLIACAMFWTASVVLSLYHSCVQCCVVGEIATLRLPIPLVCRLPLSSNHATATWEQLVGGSLYSENTYCGLFPENSCVLGVNYIHCSALTYNLVVVLSKYAPHSGSTSRHLPSGSNNRRCRFVGKHCVMAAFHLFHALSLGRPCCSHLMLE